MNEQTDKLQGEHRVLENESEEIYQKNPKDLAEMLADYESETCTGGLEIFGQLRPSKLSEYFQRKFQGWKSSEYFQHCPNISNPPVKK